MSVIDKGSSSIALLAHRGYAARYPENTREAIAAAVAAGARAVEFDVQLSRDYVPHLLHDDTFERTAGVADSIFDLDAEQVAELGVAERDRFEDEFVGIRAPKLAEVVQDISGWPEVTAFVEIKRQSVAHFGVTKVLDAVLAAIEPVLQQCVIISFDAEVLREARRRTKRPIGWAIRTWDGASRNIADELQPEYLFCNQTKLPPVPQPLWAGDWAWVIYEVTDPDKARELAARGVGVIETMAFAEMYAALSVGQ
jgi:glycerophosphoryl diester phosphodiesterase